MPPASSPAERKPPRARAVRCSWTGSATSGIVPDTSNEEARRWFDQGVRLIWAFDEVEAVRAFREAQRLDPDCAMCFWGEAWARGPTINLNPRTEELAEARAAAERALRLSRNLPDPQKRLVRAMRERTGEGEFRNARYATIMERLAARHPADDAIQVIAADARMVAAEDMKRRRALAAAPARAGARPQSRA